MLGRVIAVLARTARESPRVMSAHCCPTRPAVPPWAVRGTPPCLARAMARPTRAIAKRAQTLARPRRVALGLPRQQQGLAGERATLALARIMRKPARPSLAAPGLRRRQRAPAPRFPVPPCPSQTARAGPDVTGAFTRLGRVQGPHTRASSMTVRRRKQLQLLTMPRPAQPSPAAPGLRRRQRAPAPRFLATCISIKCPA
jgi:hypothetical protein